ncbi:MAG: transcription-repair coupling factor (superfamily II helicase) [Parcubacteria group bacterium Gr01-1014_38]|nr:MAG: transcription-repair coupling factor (superfamily II helicase) [Parcubacteria group bacterium Gr01-1014_38]
MNIPASGVFRELWDAVRTDTQQHVPALPESALPFFLARLPAPLSGRPVVVVLAERTELPLPRISRAIQFWQRMPVEGAPLSPLPLTVLPVLLPQERSGDIPTPRLRAFWQAIASLRNEDPRLILATPRELQQPSPSSTTDLGEITLQNGQKLALTALAARLLELGYSEERGSAEPGTFVRRGGVFDIFPFSAEAPLRVEYVGDVIDRIVSLERPGKNGGADGENGSVETMLTKTAEAEPRRWTVYPLSLPKKLGTNFSGLLDRAYVIAEDGVLPSTRRVDLLLTPLSESRSPLADAPVFEGDLERFQKALREIRKKNERVFLLTARPKALAEAVDALPHATIIPADTAAETRGFIDRREGIHVFTDADLGETTEETPLTWDSGIAYARRFRVGEYVVHRDHGIARFRGIERKTFAESAREYLILEYAQRDRLYVPVELASKVTAYVGAANPIVHRLGGTEWEMTTRAVRAEASDLARELLAQYAARETEAGTTYPPDTQADQDLEAVFPYEETADQAAAIREVKRDMERAQPMDRLVCGDVGFGKTEVAIRAAFKAVNFGRQVAVLTPTTLLAQQHFDTFQDRLKDTGARIALLSRLQSPAEEEAVLQELADGKIQIIIGTHRLLSEDVRFKNLGLLIIDEEQKFGVAQKERLKKVRTAVDVLSLSATPIPRTLHMALSGLRSLSVIATPPAGRRPVVTKVARENDALTKKALEDELARKGQAYVLWNRVETIDAAAERIRALVPGARVVVAHGQMPELELMRVMEEFDTRRADILVCSTIIENGIDLPNVNTLIVFDAPSFGLADLYQIRGRVGRGNQQAYAYFLYSQGRLAFEARKRLAALLEAVELGSGWTLALRDLEIRGAGNLLGREQHGTIRAVGVHLFGELLAEEVEKLRSGGPSLAMHEVQIDLPVKAFLPESYIPNTDTRLAAYTRISSARTPPDLEAARVDLEATYGTLPPEAEAFFKLVHVKFLAVDAGVSAMTESSVVSGPREATRSAHAHRRTTLTFREGLTPALAYAAIADNPRWTFTGSSMFLPTHDLQRSSAHGSDLLDCIAHTLRVLADARRKEASGLFKVLGKPSSGPGREPKTSSPRTTDS